MLRQLTAALCLAAPAAAAPPKPTLPEPMRTVDLNVGESQEVELPGGKKVAVRLLDLRETRDRLRDAVRLAEVKVEVAGQPVTLVSANYRLPTAAGGARIGPRPLLRQPVEEGNLAIDP